jgi:hypothetical protein
MAAESLLVSGFPDLLRCELFIGTDSDLHIVSVSR